MGELREDILRIADGCPPYEVDCNIYDTCRECRTVAIIATIKETVGKIHNDLMKLLPYDFATKYKLSLASPDVMFFQAVLNLLEGKE